MRAPWTFTLAALLFFFSGALGLGYELVWIQKASLVVGASQIALATVLTSFFLGLGLGSLAVGRYLRSRRWSPLFVYGIFEAAIGIFALLLPWLFRGLESTYGTLYPIFDGSAAGLLLLRFTLVFALFLVPTFFMGGTLPLLLDGLVARDRAIGGLTSLLYGLNILGAVAGVLATSFFAIPALGLNGTSTAAGLCNLAVGAVAMLAFRRLEPLHPPDESEPATRPEAFFVAASFVSGFTAIAYQVLWARYFSMFSRAEVHFTAVFLATYLAALAIGSLILAPVLRGRIHPLRVLVVLQPLAAVLVLLCLDLWWPLRYDIGANDDFEVSPSWSFWSETADATFFAPLLAVTSVILAPVILLGTGLPSLIAAATSRAGSLRATAGTLVFWNTLGCSAGGVAAGYGILPGMGLTYGLTALAALPLGLAAAAEWRMRAQEPGPGARRILRAGYVPAAVALAVIVLWGRDDVTRRTLLRTLSLGEHIAAIEEGPVTTAYVLDSRQGRILGAGSVRLATAFRDSLSPQVLQGYIPMLFYPAQGWPESVLGIAIGTGQTFGAFLEAPIARMDVVDISAEVVDLALAQFGEFNHGIGVDPRVRFHFDDGRHFVARAPAETYDVVSLEPPPPTDEGVYRLYSLEFYQGVHRVLRDRGVLVQWLPPYLVAPGDLRGMVKTQAEVFPNTFVLASGPRDLVIMSIKGEAPPRFHTARIQERIAHLREDGALRDLRWPDEPRPRPPTVENVLSLLVTGPGDIARMEAPCIHREDDLRLSYSSGDRELLRRYMRNGLAQITFAALPVTPFADVQQYFEDPLPVAALEEARANVLAEYGALSPGRLAAAPDALAVAALYSRAHRMTEALEWMRRAIPADPAQTRTDSMAQARQIARSRGVLYHDQIRAWLASLSPQERASPLVEAVARELQGSQERESTRRSRYLRP